MSCSINASTSGAGGVITTADNTGILNLQTASTNAVTIDASQNVGIGTTSPKNKLSVQSGNFSFQSTTTSGSTSVGYINGYSDINGSQYELGKIDFQTGAFADAGFMLFSTRTGAGALTERMRIDSSGNVLVGVTSPGSYIAGSAIGTTGYISRSGTGGSFSNNRFNIYWNGSAARLWIDNVDQGSIAISSDYRIKKDIQAQTLTAIDRIAQLKPVTYTYADNEDLNWKADGVAREGFIAHELAEVIPSAVDGEKDAENQIQSLKLDALCSVMVKAIQEQQTIINDLKARVTALEAK